MYIEDSDSQFFLITKNIFLKRKYSKKCKNHSQIYVCKTILQIKKLLFYNSFTLLNNFFDVMRVNKYHFIHLNYPPENRIRKEYF